MAGGGIPTITDPTPQQVADSQLPGGMYPGYGGGMNNLAMALASLVAPQPEPTAPMSATSSAAASTPAGMSALTQTPIAAPSGGIPTTGVAAPSAQGFDYSGAPSSLLKPRKQKFVGQV